MLVLSRKANETIRIADDIVITVVAIDGGTVKLGIQAPSHISVHRGEIYQRIQEENRQASTSAPNQMARLARLWKNKGKAEVE
jgi:carbon storage regulator